MKTTKKDKKEVLGTTIKNCTFNGPKIEWNEDASEAVLDVAEGLMNLTRLFMAQNIKVECLVKIGGKDES
uniref:Uncharacterized protein n=1 Tax=viral metagenome TaxID=1070528 RepID=A0A6H2A282_9ZZZZ